MVSVTIIGAGPAGCHVAYNLNQKFSVTLIDRSNFPRNKPCGGILIEESVNSLSPLFPPFRIYSSPKYLDLVYLDWDNNIEFKQKREFQNINRSEFDYWLFKLATNKSNVIFVRGRVKTVHHGEKFVVLVESDAGLEKFESDILIDASGAYSVTGRAESNRQNRYTAIQFELKHNKKFGDFNYILANSLSDYYSWAVSKGDSLFAGSCFNRGMMKDNVEILKKIFSKKLGLDFEECTMQAAPIFRPLSINDVQLVRKNIFVIGEAAGLISPSTGEGISYALRSAKACAEAINENEGLKQSQQDYIDKGSYLLDDIKDKIQRAKVLMSIKQRKEFFKTFYSVSESQYS